MKRSKSWLAAALAVTLACAAWQARPAIANLSDVWYDPAESGWGVNIAQQGDVATVTLMVYGPTGEPTWFVASHAAAYAWSGEGLPFLRGTLYRTRGMWFGGPFDSRSVQVTPVGEVYVSPLAPERVRIDYTVEGIAASKTVQRATWNLPAIDWAYVASFSLRVRDGEGGVALQTSTGITTLLVEAGAATMTVIEPGVRCTYRGPYRQTGRLGSFAGTYACSDARGGAFQVDDLEFTGSGFAGRIRAQWAGGSLQGAFGGPRR